MRRPIILLLAGWLAAGTPASLGATPALLPRPATVVAGNGHFLPDARTAIVVRAGDKGASNSAARLAELVERTSGISFTTASAPPGPAIRFVRKRGLPAEGYRLEVGPRGATITASDDAGLLYGGITLWQLMTPDGAGALRPVEAVRIEDAPRFPWRGLMLDSARHFQSPAFVKQLIDWMAAHKLNIFHWHLVDDQGWRIEIKRYPRLTEIGAWRVPASAPGAPALPRTGGYYTQHEIREIVAYATARGVTIVPEIEMPGHALPAIRAYPTLGTGAPVPAGVEAHWGVFPWLYNVEDDTFQFLENVLDEVMALFPSRYIHVGGDEAVKDQWKASSQVQARLKALGLRDEAALQSWFIQRIERYLNARGRKLIGWDEILDGGLAPNATVMSWRGIDGAVAAAKAGHDAVLSPAPGLYFDHIQASDDREPPGRGGVISLADVYRFNPMPEALAPAQRKHILGLQGNLWTEHVRTEARAAWMAFPRASAVAEIGWSGAAGKFDDFLTRLVPQLDRLRPFGLAAADSAFAVTARAEPADAGRVQVTLASQVGADIRYTTDGGAPGANATPYRGPVTLAPSTRLRAAAFLDGRALPGALDRTFDAASARRRDDGALKLCTEKVPLRLEDDAPAQGPRAAFVIDIFNPCWIYEAAPLDGVTEIALDVGQLPFNFQVGADRDKIAFHRPATPEGEFEVRIGGCEGERIAVLPLAAAAANPAVSTIRAAVTPRTGRQDLCITYTAKGPDPLWALDAVQLVAP